MTGKCVSCDPAGWVRGSALTAVQEVRPLDLLCEWYSLQAEGCEDVSLPPRAWADLSVTCGHPLSSGESSLHSFSFALCDVRLVAEWTDYSGYRV